MHLIKAIFELHCVQFYWIYCHYSAKNGHGGGRGVGGGVRSESQEALRGGQEIRALREGHRALLLSGPQRHHLGAIPLNCMLMLELQHGNRSVLGNLQIWKQETQHTS